MGTFLCIHRRRNLTALNERVAPQRPQRSATQHLTRTDRCANSAGRYDRTLRGLVARGRAASAADRRKDHFADACRNLRTVEWANVVVPVPDGTSPSLLRLPGSLVMTVTHPLTALPHATDPPSPRTLPAADDGSLDRLTTAGQRPAADILGTDHGQPGDADLADSHTAATIRSLVRAAQGLDVDIATDTVRASITDHGVLWTWKQLIHPVWNILNTDNDPNLPDIAERLFSQCMSQTLIAAQRAGDRKPTRVLLACADEEHHTLPLDAVAAALTANNIGSCVLGARVPPRALAAATESLHPAVTVIWSQTHDTSDPHQITSLLATRRSLTVIAAGPGWDSAKLPPPAGTFADVDDVHRLTVALLSRDAQS